MLMPMQAASLEVPEKAAVPPAQARAVVRQMHVAMQSQLAVMAGVVCLLVSHVPP